MSAFKHLTCREVVELASEFLDEDGGLPPEERIELEQHLLVCPPCTVHIEQVRTTVAIAARLRQPSSVTPSVMNVFRTWKKA